MVKPFLLSALLALAAACTGSESTPTIDGAAMETEDGGLKAFGQPCTTPSDMSTECESGVCTNSFDMLTTPVCSQKCTVLGGNDPTCPVGSMGQKCNRQGYCRP